MDDALSPWLRLALCPHTPNPLLRELLSSQADLLSGHTESLNQWLSTAAPKAPPPITLPDDLQPLAGAWELLAKQLNSATVNKAIEKATHWASSDHNRHLLTPDHPQWPTQLHTLTDPPALLYAIGDPTLLSADQLSLIPI